MTEPRKYYGKYRGTVARNDDPEQRGRLMAVVVGFGMTPLTWAMPCVPLAGPQMGAYAVPPIGAGVWIEFEQGDPDYPIWSGCWWGGREELPTPALAAPPSVQNIVFQTLGQYLLRVSDGPLGGITLGRIGGPSITINDAGGIVITDGQSGKIVISKGVVSINGPALVVK